MKTKVFVSTFLVVSFLLFSLMLIGGTVAKAGEIPKSIKMSAGAMGQSPYMLLAVLSQYMEEAMPGLKVTVIAGGGMANLKLIDSKKVDIAFTVDFLYGNAIRGESPYEKKYTDLRVIADVQGRAAMYFMVTEDTGLTSIDEIKEKKYPLKICTFLKAGPPEVDARRTLEAYGMNYDDIRSWGGNVNFSQWTDCVSQVRDGHANALLGATTLPSSFHAEAAKARKIRMLPLKEEVIKEMIKKYKYLRVIIPKNTYGITPYDMPSIGSTDYFFAHKDLNPEIVYEFVKQLAKHEADLRMVHASYKNFEAEKMASSLLGEIHPGALKFYQEKRWVK